MKLAKDIIDLFEKSDYSARLQPWGLVLNHNPSGRQFLSIVSLILGFILLIFSIQSASWKLMLFSVILIGLPFTLHNWRLPESVTFNEDINQISIKYLKSEKLIASGDEPELVVDYEARTGFVSPFEDGYQDHYYVFYLKTKTEKLKLFRLKSRKKINDKIGGLVNEFAKLSIWK